MSKFNSFKKFNNKDIDLLKGFKGNDICGKISEKFQDNTNISYVKFFPDNDSYALTGLSELRLSFQSNNKTTDVFHPDDIIKLRLTEDPNEYTTPNGDRYLSLDFCFKNGTVFKKINDSFEPIGSSKELNTYFLTFPRKNDIGDPVMYITVEGCCNKNPDGKSVVFEDLQFVKSNEKMLGSLADYGIKSIHIINDYANNKWPDSFIDGNNYSICLAGTC